MSLRKIIVFIFIPFHLTIISSEKSSGIVAPCPHPVIGFVHLNKSSLPKNASDGFLKVSNDDCDYPESNSPSPAPQSISPDKKSMDQPKSPSKIVHTQHQTGIIKPTDDIPIHPDINTMIPAIAVFAQHCPVPRSTFDGESQPNNQNKQVTITIKAYDMNLTSNDDSTGKQKNEYLTCCLPFKKLLSRCLAGLRNAKK